MDDALIRLRVLQAEDERPYKDAMTAFAAFASSVSNPTATATAIDESAYRLEQAMAVADLSLTQWSQTQQTYHGESAMHASAIAGTLSQSEGLQRDIDAAKEKLANAKVVRTRKEEYRNVIHQIEAQQSRDRSAAELTAIDREIGGLQRELDEAKSELDLKRKQLALLLHALTLTVETEAHDPNNGTGGGAEPESAMG